MTAHVEGSFTVTAWDEQTYRELDGVSKLTRASVSQHFSGGLEADGDWEAHMFYAEDGTAFYTGLQRFTGTLDGREGTFVAEARGGYDGSAATSELTVVAGSGTGALAGLSGTGSAAAGSGTEGTYSFDYALG
jgi:hypothetical protein